MMEKVHRGYHEWARHVGAHRSGLRLRFFARLPVRFRAIFRSLDRSSSQSSAGACVSSSDKAHADRQPTVVGSKRDLAAGISCKPREKQLAVRAWHPLGRNMPLSFSHPSFPMSFLLQPSRPCFFLVFFWFFFVVCFFAQGCREGDHFNLNNKCRESWFVGGKLSISSEFRADNTTQYLLPTQPPPPMPQPGVRKLSVKSASQQGYFPIYHLRSHKPLFPKNLPFIFSDLCVKRRRPKTDSTIYLSLGFFFSYVGSSVGLD